MSLKVRPRKDRDGLWITGTVAGERIRIRAASDIPKLAREEASTLETKILREAWHGARPGIRTFASAVASYLDHEERSTGTQSYLARIMRALGDVSLSDVNQEAIDRIRPIVLAPDVAPATVTRSLIAPIRAVLTHSQKRGWCSIPGFDAPRAPEGRTSFMLPAQANLLIQHAAKHIKPLLIFLFCSGARMAEAIELEWDAVDLPGCRAILWKTKGGKRRIVNLPSAAVAALANLKHRKGAVFRSDDGAEYYDRERRGGGHIKTAWAGALRRSGLDGFTPHDTRHSWASWHYAIHKDLLLLKADGGWSSISMVERYAHLMPVDQRPEILSFWHQADTRQNVQREIA